MKNSSQAETMILDDVVVEEIRVLGERRRPAEACGLVLPARWPRKPTKLSPSGRVIELPNRSESPHDSCLVWGTDMRVALGDWIAAVPGEAVELITMWHTHPSGLIGPSLRDMQTVVPGLSYFVVALPEDGPATTTWYGKPRGGHSS